MFEPERLNWVEHARHCAAPFGIGCRLAPIDAVRAWLPAKSK